MPRRPSRLKRDFFATDPITLARALLGRRLVRVLDDGTRLAGIIVETEAYLGIPDAAAHTFGGRRTPRNEAMYARPGTAYVYFTYGNHFCMNVVCGREGDPVAVLLRALEPVEGLEKMRQLRGTGWRARSRKPIPKAGARPLSDEDLCRGPGRLCEALAIDRSLNAIDLTADNRLFIEPGEPVQENGIGISPRIGVDGAGLPWAAERLRFFTRGSAFVSGPPRVNRLG
jgi:DNA-3-methyladenine glycosylase